MQGKVRHRKTNYGNHERGYVSNQEPNVYDDEIVIQICLDLKSENIAMVPVLKKYGDPV